MLKISVVIPVYNGVASIANAVQSVLNQSVPVSEIIVINDGSTDDTFSVLNEIFYSEILTGTIRLVNKANEGPSIARNMGVAMAASEWVAFLDADDTWDLAKIEIQARFLLSNPDIALCSTLTTRNGLLNAEDVLYPSKRQLLLKNYFATSSVVVNRQIFLNVNGFNVNQKYSEDYNLWLKIVLNGAKSAVINKVLVNYDNNQVDGRLSRNNMAMLNGELANWRELRDKKLINLYEFWIATAFSKIKFQLRKLKRG